MAERFTYKEDSLALLPSRPKRSNKGTFGRVCVVGGAVGMAGAVYFSAKSAYRTGCGICSILSPEENRTIYQTLIPEATLTVYDWNLPDEQTVKNTVCRSTVSVIGVGLGTSETSKKLLTYALSALSTPCVIDADALNILSANPKMWEIVPKNSVVTPHPLEMSRLTGLDLREILDDIPGIAERFALRYGVICVMKDANTAVSDGERTMINSYGNSGLATAGSGDVLSGIIASLIAQGMNPFEAASLGVYIHSRAGDFAAKKLSEYSIMASDIIDHISSVLLGAQ